jgi:hypothetical protein
MPGSKKKKARIKDHGKETGDKAKAPPKALDDDIYESGDIATPERDRDDEQRDL